jgi:hypothetical protein
MEKAPVPARTPKTGAFSIEFAWRGVNSDRRPEN